ncbi:MAG: MFS transporter [Halanaerobiales bacterium]|nr:MFS transporter [Halanaerobiales bacterium]
MKYFGLLKVNSNLRNLWFAQLISRLGDNIHMIAMIYYVYSLTGSAFNVGKVLIFFTIPTLLTPFFGIVIDNYSKKHIMIISDLVRALLVLVIPFTKSMTVIYIITFFLQLVNQFFSPSRRSLLPEIVSDSELLKSNSLLESTKMFMKIIGPSIAGVIIALSGSQIAFFLNSISFFLSVIILSRISNSNTANNKPFVKVASNFSKELIEGIRAFSSNRTIWMITLLSAFVSISVGANNALVVVFVEKFLGLGSQEYGLLVTFLGVGMFVGSIYIGNRKELNKLSLSLALLITGISFLAFANIKNFPIALILRLLIGIGMGIFTVISATLMQKATTKDTRGRIFTINSTLSNGSMMISMTIFSFLADKMSISHVLSLASVWYFIAFVISIFFTSNLYSSSKTEASI